MPAPHQLTPAAHAKLSAELAERKGRRHDISDRIGRARELGDLKENAEYHSAKDEQGLNEADIRRIESILENCEIVEPTAAHVSVGCVVGITYGDDDEVEQYFVGRIEESHDHHDVVTPDSPLGSTLLGAVLGQTLDYEAPNGNVLKVTIASIEV